MKYLIFVFSALITCSCNSINGSGNIITETRNVNEFDGVQTSGSMDVEIMNGDNTSVKVEADDNVLSYIVTDVHDGLLDVYYKPNTSFSNTHEKIYVTANGLKRLFVKGSGSITSGNTIKSAMVEAKISGSGDIDAGIDAPEVNADISGSGNLSLKGRCRTFNGNIGGSGDLKCKNLLSENAAINIMGSGTAHVFSSVHLKASTLGSGDIYYSGYPSIESNKSGSGSVQPEK